MFIQQNSDLALVNCTFSSNQVQSDDFEARGGAILLAVVVILLSTTVSSSITLRLWAECCLLLNSLCII